MVLDLELLFRQANHGLVTSGQMVRAGVSYDNQVALAQDGILQRLLFGTYRHAGLPVPETQAAALPLVYLDQRRPRGHAESRLSGAAGLRARGVGPARWPVSPLVLVDHRCRARPTGLPFGLLRTAMPLEAEDHVNRLRLAPVARCLVDLAADPRSGDDELYAAVDDIRSLGLARLIDLTRAWLAIGGRGARRLDELLAHGYLEAESPAERRMLREVFQPHPPMPDCQVTLLGSLRVDFAYLSAGLVIEYYGKDSHANRVDEDGSRTYALEGLGNRVLIATKSMLRDPAGFASHVHCIRRDREQRIASGALPRPPLPPQLDRVTPLRTLYPLG